MALRCDECRTEIEYGKPTVHLCPRCHFVLVGDEVALALDALRSYMNGDMNFLSVERCADVRALITRILERDR